MREAPLNEGVYGGLEGRYIATGSPLRLEKRTIVPERQLCLAIAKLRTTALLLGCRHFLRRLYWKDRSKTVNLLFIIVAVIAVILLFTGGFVSSLNFLLYVGIILLVLAVIAFIIRALTGKKSV